MIEIEKIIVTIMGGVAVVVFVVMAGAVGTVVNVGVTIDFIFYFIEYKILGDGFHFTT